MVRCCIPSTVHSAPCIRPVDPRGMSGFTAHAVLELLHDVAAGRSRSTSSTDRQYSQTAFTDSPGAAQGDGAAAAGAVERLRPLHPPRGDVQQLLRAPARRTPRTRPRRAGAAIRCSRCVARFPLPERRSTNGVVLLAPVLERELALHAGVARVRDGADGVGAAGDAEPPPPAPAAASPGGGRGGVLGMAKVTAYSSCASESQPLRPSPNARCHSLQAPLSHA